MYSGKLVFSQLMDFLPKHTFRRCVKRYEGNHKIKSFSCYDQFLSMAFAQLTYRDSLRSIETSLRAHSSKLYHLGIKGGIARNTLSNANEQRDWRIYADFAQCLIHEARSLYAKEDFGVDLKNTVYALDATTIDLCLSLFPWAKFRRTKAAIKLHTLLDLRGSIPSFIHITDGTFHDVNVLDILVTEPGAFYIMDRAFVDFARLYSLHQNAAYFVVRAKRNLSFRRRYSNPCDKKQVLCDQTVTLPGPKSSTRYPEALRRIKFYDADSNKTFCFLTNNFTVDALDIAALYKHRWRVELFFKWIKQHLRIKTFYGTSTNAVKTQIWIAIAVYVLVAIVKKRLNIEASLYTILQVLSVTIFDKMPMQQLFQPGGIHINDDDSPKQLNLWPLTLGH